MNGVKIFSTDQYVLPLPETHRFPVSKYALLRQRVVAEGLATGEELVVPHAATDEEILRAHDLDYLVRLQGGHLMQPEERRLGFPWSPQLIERARRSTGATIEACQAALQQGLAVNLAGGTHH